MTLTDYIHDQIRIEELQLLAFSTSIHTTAISTYLGNTNKGVKKIRISCDWDFGIASKKSQVLTKEEDDGEKQRREK